MNVIVNDVLSLPHLIARKNIFSFLHQWFRITDPQGDVLLYTKMRGFRLKEDIRILGSDKVSEVVVIRARQVIDFGATYDVMDGPTGQKLGAFRRKGLKSLFKDEWLILDTADGEVGMISEDSGGLAFLRRFLGGVVNLFAPQQHHGALGQVPVLAFRQTRNPFVTKTFLDFSMDSGKALDRRLGLAAAVLFCAIEGKQG
ncbi:MAG: hypothetical protein AAGI48_14590 [Verrucomicrobiota bacterium]